MRTRGVPQTPALSSHILVIPGPPPYSHPFTWSPRCSPHSVSLRGHLPLLTPMALCKTLEVWLLVSVLPAVFRACACHRDPGLGARHLSVLQQNITLWNSINRKQLLGKWPKGGLFVASSLRSAAPCWAVSPSLQNSPPHNSLPDIYAWSL